MIYVFLKNTTTKIHRLDSFNLSSYGSRDKMSSSLVSSEAGLLGLQMTAFSLCPHVAFGLCAHLCCLSVCPNLAVVTLVLIRVD